ncbi:hypothetical protein GJAV_G00197110 [Gymnothorax javanicus]|nr:hypothetical protein GJAV_G00197110 [Gymnothorax javanicus]
MEVVVVDDQASANIPQSQGGPLVAVTFKKNPHQSQKYLEAEPKALGVTQISLSVFQISMVVGINVASGFGSYIFMVIQIIGSLFVIIAGSIAVAAQSLHLPTVKACLGMQVVATVTSLINVLASAVSFADKGVCWRSSYGDIETHELCHNLLSGREHYLAEILLSNIAVVAICVALAAYCCKAVNCCTPRANTPVITINGPPAQQ